MMQRFSVLFLSLLLAIAPVAAVAAGVVSENLVFLKEDGRSYLLHRSMRTDARKYNFHVEKQIGLERFFYIDPDQYEWDDASGEYVNTLKFSQGSFTVMYPGDYGERVGVDAEGIYTLDTWNGITRQDGRFGIWNQPGNFDRFVQAWVFPETFKILGYESNRDGEWVERNNTLAFFAEDVNDLTFTVRYMRVDADADGVADVHDRCAETPEGVSVDETGCAADTDGDGVMNRLDKCAGTPPGAGVDASGCEQDADGDGVIDRLDTCPDTAPGAMVTRDGCELDCDADGVLDNADRCPGTVHGSRVDVHGCVPDSDGDGVADSRDRCAQTPPDVTVDATGCAVDSDGDGVADSDDRCRETSPGVTVDATGCAVDTDSDGVADDGDRCPETPSGVTVDANGCEEDSDGDGVSDSHDHCQETPTGVTVDAIGCETDSDDDGVVDSRDRCPQTPSDMVVDAVGCETDSDGDGVSNILDLCPDTMSGIEVDATGCTVSSPIALRGVNFHFNSDELMEESVSVLDGVAVTLLAHPDLKLEVAGHTDSEGDETFNLELSQRRAEKVRNYLVSKGVDAMHLSARGYGEQRPVSDNSSAAGRAENRRVELIRLVE